MPVSKLRGASACTRPSEPILLPKLGIEFADFPYLRGTDSAEATNLGDWMRMWVRFVSILSDVYRGARRAHAAKARNTPTHASLPQDHVFRDPPGSQRRITTAVPLCQRGKALSQFNCLHAFHTRQLEKRSPERVTAG